MTSTPIRDQAGDHLITPQNSALLLIDYQPSQIGAVRSMDHDLLLKNVISMVKVAKLFEIPIIHSTINVANGQGPTLPGLAEELADFPPIDRTAINSWEDVDFLAAVRATGRRKLLMCALWTEVCMAFPSLDALRQGYEVYPVIDAIGGTSPEAHRAGIGPSRPAASQSAGSRSPVSCSATGTAPRRSRKSSRSSSTRGSSKSEPGALPNRQPKGDPS
jgi:nicotinamidase-related amidase